jgi:peptide chain release factor 1
MERMMNLQELTTMLNDKALDSDLRKLAEKDYVGTTATITTVSRSLQLALVPKHPFVHLPGLIEIRPGMGGSGAAMFSLDLWQVHTA